METTVDVFPVLYFGSMFIYPFGVRKFKINPIEIGSMAGRVCQRLSLKSYHCGLTSRAPKVSRTLRCGTLNII